MQEEDIILCIHLKTNQLQREFLPTLTSNHVYSTLMGTKWKKGIPKNRVDMVEDVFSLTIDTVVEYLSLNAIIEGSRMNISQFEDLIGGK